MSKILLKKAYQIARNILHSNEHYKKVVLSDKFSQNFHKNNPNNLNIKKQKARNGHDHDNDNIKIHREDDDSYFFDFLVKDLNFIISRVLNVSIYEIFINPSLIIAKKDFDRIIDYTKKRAKGHPIAYIFGTSDFYNRSFYVNEHTLIPRIESEKIIDIAKSKFDQDANIAILDLGAGSANLCVTLALEFFNATVHAWDISTEALLVCEKNRARFHIDFKRLSFYHKDMLDKNNFLKCQDKGFFYDLIVINPPYIANNKRQIDLMSPDTKFEPAIALFAKKNGLEFFEKTICQYAPMILKTTDSYLICEFGYNQKCDIIKLLSTYNYYYEFQKDINFLDRYLMITLDY